MHTKRIASLIVTVLAATVLAGDLPTVVNYQGVLRGAEGGCGVAQQQ